jgi:ubiquinone/menaquinone biosynthesis C-methylase UbiE
MAVSLASAGLTVTAIDHASSAVRIAQNQAVGELAERLDIRYLHAEHLPFPDATFPVVVAFDSLCHASAPEKIVAEMFRVCTAEGLVIIAELNTLGRELTRHLDGGFEKRLPGLIRPFRSSWQILTTTFFEVYLVGLGDRSHRNAQIQP